MGHGDAPVVVIAGRPNVGKSTLFNALTRTRSALVADQPGVTRDRIYGRAELAGRKVILVDTGGLDEAGDALQAGIGRQSRLALEEADLIILLVDGRAPLSAQDHQIAHEIRRLGKATIVAVNKTDGMDPEAARAEYAPMGLGETIAIAAAHRRGLEQLAERCAQCLPPLRKTDAPAADSNVIRLTLLGRPNVGKSTLLNRLVGDERALTADLPGTTRDPISADLIRNGKRFHLVDTAGIRRRRSKQDAVESLSTLKAMQAMDQSHVVCLLIDASAGVSEQDQRLAAQIVESGRGLVIVLNKWDRLDATGRQRLLAEVGERLHYVQWAPVVVLSALHGSGIAELFDAVETVYAAATRTLSSSHLSRTLSEAVAAHAPPVVHRFAPKLRFAHPGGHFPTTIVIHGNRSRFLPESYRRYLLNRFRAAEQLTGVPLRLVFRDSENPYAGRRNKLTPRQIKRRQRVRRHRG